MEITWSGDSADLPQPTVTASLFASSSAVDTDWVVRLCRVSADGVSLGIADGIVRASWRDAYAETGLFKEGCPPSPIEPDRVYEYTISLWETALTDHVNQQTLKFILGQRSIGEWDQYVAELKGRNSDQYINLINQAYQTFKQKHG